MKQYLDSWLNRVSMYRLVSISLGVLFGSALLLSLVGYIPFSPLALIASALVLVMVVYLANLLLGRVFGVATHDESTFISGLILFFIFTPTFELTGLLTLAVVGMVAAVSKYILVLRGRHLFNPAAIAAVIAGLAGLAYASWWVATPVLLPVTLVAALLIIYKTRRQLIAAVFLAVAIPLTLIVLLGYGTAFADAFTLLGSWPLLFIAGFMLTEPLTLPARRRWQVAEAALVAVLVAMPLHVGDFATTPAVALVIGNLFAATVTRRQKLRLIFKERRQLTPSSEEYVFTSERPVYFEPGQFAELTLPHPGKDGRGIRRSFSMTSLPGQPEVTFGVKFYEPASTFKQALRRMKPGMTVTSTGVGGDFVLPHDEKVPLLFVAGGIGITPFISYLQHVKQANQARDIVIVYMISRADELAYGPLLRDSGHRVIVVSEGKLPKAQDWVARQVSALTPATFRPEDSVAARQAYVSGPPGMVREVCRQLSQAGVKKITTDYFTGY